MKYITVNLEFWDATPTIVIFGEQEELYEKYAADPSAVNEANFLSSIEEEVALNIGFDVKYFQEDLNV